MFLRSAFHAPWRRMSVCSSYEGDFVTVYSQHQKFSTLAHFDQMKMKRRTQNLASSLYHHEWNIVTE